VSRSGPIRIRTRTPWCVRSDMVCVRVRPYTDTRTDTMVCPVGHGLCPGQALYGYAHGHHGVSGRTWSVSGSGPIRIRARTPCGVRGQGLVCAWVRVAHGGEHVNMVSFSYMNMGPCAWVRVWVRVIKGQRARVVVGSVVSCGPAGPLLLPHPSPSTSHKRVRGGACKLVWVRVLVPAARQGRSCSYHPTP
jgi:hypothetical protein